MNFQNMMFSMLLSCLSLSGCGKEYTQGLQSGTVSSNSEGNASLANGNKATAADGGVIVKKK